VKSKRCSKNDVTAIKFAIIYKCVLIINYKKRQNKYKNVCIKNKLWFDLFLVVIFSRLIAFYDSLVKKRLKIIKTS